MMTDPIADMLTRLRNGLLARKRVVLVPDSKLKRSIAEILVQEGYLENAEVREGLPAMIELKLKYVAKKPMIQSITRESSPGHRLYKKSTEMPRVLNDYGIAIVSTSKGLMTNKEARKQGIGGEIICSVY